jgi:hypothetical protein
VLVSGKHVPPEIKTNAVKNETIFFDFIFIVYLLFFI